MRKFILLAIAILSLTAGYSQIKRTDKTLSFGDKKYYMHKVEAGQTLFSISKAYGISINKILNTNHKHSTDLREGEVLKIPYTAPNAVVQSVKYKHYTVKKGDTLYSLSKKFKTTEAELINLNAGVEVALIEGRRLIVPIVSEGQPRYDADYYYHIVKAKETLSSIGRRYAIRLKQLKKINSSLNPDRLKLGDEVRIPLENARAEVAAIRIINRKTKGQKEVFVEQDPNEDTRRILTQVPDSWVPTPYEPYDDSAPKNEGFLDFETVTDYTPEFKKNYNIALFLPLKNSHPRMQNYYKGMRLAIQQNSDIPADIKVYDTEKNNAKIQRILRYSYDFDFIIGPYSAATFATALPYANKDTKILSLLSKNEAVYQNPNVLQINTTERTINYKIAKYVVMECDSDNVIIFNGSTFKKYQSLDTIPVTKITNLANLLINTQQKNYVISENYQSDFEELLDENKKNVVLVPVSDYRTIGKVVNYLNGQSMNKLEVVGYYKWKLLPNISPDVLFNLNTVYFTPFAYKPTEEKAFVEAYKIEFNSYPDDFSFIGYQTMTKFLQGLRNDGLYFYKKPLQKIFKHRGGGYESIDLHKVTFSKDYKVITE